MKYRKISESDLSGIARIRSMSNVIKVDWDNRITNYWNRTHHPQHALLPRIIYAAENEGAIVGFTAGHLSLRFECDGELQWIDVIPDYRRKGIASALLLQLLTWFINQHAFRICVNCAPDNKTGQNFYKKHGAESINEYWLVWEDIRNVF